MEVSTFSLIGLTVGSMVLNINSSNTNVPVNASLLLAFNSVVNTATVPGSITLSRSGEITATSFAYLDQNRTVGLLHTENLEFNTTYNLQITPSLKNQEGLSFPGKTITFTTEQTSVHIDSLSMGGINVTNVERPQNVNRDFTASIFFDRALNPATVNSSTVRVNNGSLDAAIEISLSADSHAVYIHSFSPLVHFDRYQLLLHTSISGAQGEPFTEGLDKTFYTELDETPKFPVVSDDQLMTLIQEQTFKYFWDYGHPVSGLSRERNGSGDVVTSGGSGFGVMSIIVGIERGFITREQGVERWTTIVDFLGNTADRFHGAWSHWLNGSNGNAIPFSPLDNGADLVETSYLVQGLLTVRQYLDAGDSNENILIGKINDLWTTVEWDWFTQGGQDVLYWHWSPTNAWAMNFPIRGYNECLITYFLAAASPTHAIDASVYHNGWTNSSFFINGNTYYGYQLPLGFPYGGPLFFSHYSFLGLNPTSLTDTYANYWTQNVNHSLINHAYCVDNPLDKVGYSSINWGLTASDNYQGYSAHSPTNDLGVITPTAALSSMPYTPTESINAMKFFYYTIGDKTWGPHGFYDAFSTTEGWYGDSYLAIDQGPIIIMIENYRTALCWNLFMSAPEVGVAMTTLGFSN